MSTIPNGKCNVNDVTSVPPTPLQSIRAAEWCKFGILLFPLIIMNMDGGGKVSGACKSFWLNTTTLIYIALHLTTKEGKNGDSLGDVK